MQPAPTALLRQAYAWAFDILNNPTKPATAKAAQVAAAALTEEYFEVLPTVGILAVVIAFIFVSFIAQFFGPAAAQPSVPRASTRGPRDFLSKSRLRP